MDEFLRRRSAAWRDIEFNLDGLTYAIGTKNAEKWADDDDKQALEAVNILLKSALNLARARYSNVLTAQVREFKEAKNEQVHEG